MSKIKHFEGLEVARVNSQLRKCKAEIKTFYTWKWAPGKGVSYWKASFLVSMVVLRCGVGCWSISNAFEGLTLDLFSHGMKRGEWHGVIITWWQEDFPKSYWVLLTVLLCQPPNSYGIFSKSIFLRLTKNPCNFFGWQSFFNQTEKTFFFNHVFGWQKKTQKSLPWRPGVDEVFIAGGCPWSWYRSSRGEQWLLNGRKGSQSRNKNVLRGWRWCCWYLHLWGAGTTVGYERNLPCNTFLSDFYFVFEYFFDTVLIFSFKNLGESMNQSILSHTNLSCADPLENTGKFNWKRWILDYFESTPRMSSWHVAFQNSDKEITKSCRDVQVETPCDVLVTYLEIIV